MWKLSDGTTISDSAEITGDSELAQSMRDELDAFAEHGVPILVQMEAPPSPRELLDTSDSVSITEWVRERARLAGIELVNDEGESADADAIVDDEDVDADQRVY